LVTAAGAVAIGPAWVYNNCSFSYGPYQDDKGGVGFGVTATCPKGPGD
jgi:hypothetical protein